MNKGRRLAEILDRTTADKDESLEALRLQAKAWRILAMIALVEPEVARGSAQLLLFHSVPWVDKQWLETYIAENEAKARDCGIKAGVFTQ